MHVVVSGQVRHLAAYDLLLTRLAEARGAGAVESVTLVHWNDQADLVGECLKPHPLAADRILMLDAPHIRAPGYFFHQTYSLAAGLEARADDDIVLRLRPDTFVDEAFLANMPAVMQAHNQPLWSPFIDLTCPFFACDIVFGGRAWALRAQTNYSVEPYLIPVPADTDRPPGHVYSHEPEVQRWLHPTRGHDWRTEAYWTLFPSLGLATPYRGVLMRGFAAWDFYRATRTAWLEYVADNIALGGLDKVGRLGLIRTDGATSERVMVHWLDVLDEPEELCSEATLAYEATNYLWTSDVGKAERFLAYLKDRCGPERKLSAAEARAELAEIWRSARAGFDTERPPPLRKLPYARNFIVFNPPTSAG